MPQAVPEPHSVFIWLLLGLLAVGLGKFFARVVLRLERFRPTQGEAKLRPRKSCPGCPARAALSTLKSRMNRGEEGAKEAEELLEKVVKDFGDVNAGRGTIGKIAERDLFELRFSRSAKSLPKSRVKTLTAWSSN